MPEIFVFGDSIAYGAWDAEGGWAQRLRKHLDKESASSSEKYFLVYNLGVSGDTTADLIQRMEAELLSRRDEREETIILIAIGINDAVHLDAQRKTKVSLAEFTRNIRRLSMVAQQHAAKAFFIGLTPVDESKTVPIPWSTGKSYRNPEIQQFNAIIRRECGTGFIGIMEHFIHDHTPLLGDGLHPNSAGHQRIFEIVRDRLKREKII